MPLAEYVPERAPIAFKGGGFSVRGLTLDDVGVLVRAHMDDLEQVLNLYQSTTDASLRMDALVMSLASDAPTLAANIIGLAADEPASAAVVRLLPLPVQIEALLAIGTLTFEEAGGLGKFVATVGTLIGRIAPAPQNLSELPIPAAA